jgi:hypothetical protein
MCIESDNQQRRGPSVQEENIVLAVDTVWRVRPASCPNRDAFDEASEDSFPTSDAPSWTVVTATGIPQRPGRV